MIHPSTPDIICYLNEMLEADRDAIWLTKETEVRTRA